MMLRRLALLRLRRGGGLRIRRGRLVQFAGESRRDSSDNKHSGSNETDHLRASSRLGQQASLRRPTHCKCRPRDAGTGSTVKGLNVRPGTRIR